MAAPSPKRARKEDSSGEPAAGETVWICSRKSALAMQQTHTVMRLLNEITPGKSYRFAVLETDTYGDTNLKDPLNQMGGNSLFCKELETHLLEKRARLAVHSCKDMMTRLPQGLCIGAFIKRDAVEDVMLVRKDLMGKYATLADLPQGSVVGTSSLRRRAVLARLHPGLKFENIRGNIGTRLKKLDTEKTGEEFKYAATVLAKAGIDRMGTPEWLERVTQVLDADTYGYAVSQGVIAVECGDDDKWLLELLGKISDSNTAIATRAERAFMRSLQGGCHVPVSVQCFVSAEKKSITLCGRVLSLDGKRQVEEKVEGSNPEDVGENLGRLLKEGGAKELLAEATAARDATGRGCCK
eukprot:Hpha_TRINITY_DN16451_c1_g1::TRINITY_DN16451_c1_g1_i1::g.163142::m.163142/K01749/hemC, HMBS; hydroxymethylbilane synthase